MRRAAERFQVSSTTAKRWTDRYRLAGAAGMSDRSSRPHHSPARTPRRTEQRIIKLRVTHRLGPARIGGRLGLAPSTVHRVLTRYHCPPLTHLDRATGRTIRRYEHDRPGDLVHVDVKKLGNIPDGGGWRITGRATGKRNRATTPGATRDRHGGARLGYAYPHTAIDDHSRLAHTQILADEPNETTVTFWQRAHTYFTGRGITVKQFLTDNGGCYKSFLRRDTLTTARITHKRTRPYRPQTNGKVERLHHTLTDEWAYTHPHTSQTQPRPALHPGCTCTTITAATPHSAASHPPAA